MTIENVLLIDDNSKKLGRINHALGKILKPYGVHVNAWNPVQCDKNPAQIIKNYLKDNPVMVITDNELSSDGLDGFYGPTIVQWCKSQLIPVGEYSQVNEVEYFEQPNLFDIALPSDTKIAPKHIASIVEGFISIRNFIEANEKLFKEKIGLPKLISTMLGRDHLHLEFYPYIENVALASKNIVLFMNGTKKFNIKKLQTISTYVIGHLLLNSILKFPGPIISKQALCSYLSIETTTTSDLEKVFQSALYKGPFNSIGPFFWREDINQIMQKNYNDITGNFDGYGAINRAVLQKLGISAKPFECHRCNGKYGGFFCPYTQKTVCELLSCSLTSSTFIPSGNNLCRIDKKFFDRWAPLLNN